MVRKIVGILDAGDSSHWGTSDADYINKYLTGVDQSQSDPVVIATTTMYTNQKLQVSNPAGTFQYLFTSSAIGANVSLVLPLLAGNDQITTDGSTTILNNKTISGASNTITNIPDTALSVNVDLLNTAQTVTAAETFNDGMFLLRNPANTFSATIKAGAQTAAQTFTFPVTASDTIATIAATQTLTNKTISGASNTISAIPDTALSANVDLLNTTQTVTAAETFNDGTFLLRNPANTFSATIKAGAQTAAQTFTFPVTASDTIDTIAATATLSNKTLNTVTITDANNIVLGSTTGTKIGTATTQKIGFLNTAPAAQQTGGVLTAATTYGTNEQSMLQKAYNALRTFGFLS